MVPRSAAPCQNPTGAPVPGGRADNPHRADGNADWQRDLKDAFATVPELLAALDLSPDALPDLDPNPEHWRLRVPRTFARRMRPGDPADPLLRQVLPLGAERLETPGFTRDPVGDGTADRGDGLLRKYAGRALLLATGACAIHCRYCFRRHFPYGELGPTRSRLAAALARVAADESLTEIVLSGGDPLLLDDDALARLIEALGSIPHLRRLRIHTRLPVALPARVTQGLCERLAASRLQPLAVVHANHARELDGAARAAMARLRAAGIVLLNQAVLLRGVNDSTTALCELSESLFASGILPYYLHQLDPVAGAAHFAVPDDRARQLLRELRSRLPGYLVPRLVRETPGLDCKEPL